MKSHMKIAMVIAALALAAAPALAVAGEGNGHGKGHGPHYTPENGHPETPGPGAPLPEKAKAYGVYCRGESKKHVDGQKGTPFSQCVTAMAKAAHNERLTPAQACKEESKKHVKGQKGTPFSQCVSGAAKLRRHEHEEEQA
jgi:hypothetical protein